MTTKRSQCVTCLKEKGTVELLSEEEAKTHRDNYVHHHVIINADTEEKESYDNP